jgi:hypothetical protein
VVHSSVYWNHYSVYVLYNVTYPSVFLSAIRGCGTIYAFQLSISYVGISCCWSLSHGGFVRPFDVSSCPNWHYWKQSLQITNSQYCPTLIHYQINYTKLCYAVFVYWQMAKFSPTLISVCRIQSFPTQEVRFLKYRHNSRKNTVKSYRMHSFCVKELYTFKSSRSSDFMQNFQDNVFQKLDNHTSRLHRRTPVEMYHSPRRLPTYRFIVSGYT